MGRLRNVVLTTALIAPALIALTPTASYAADPTGTCTVTSGVATVTFDADAANGDTAGFGYDIDDVTSTHLSLYLAHDNTQLPAVSCSATTIDNITSINITGTADGNSLGIGEIQETDQSYIPMSIDLGGGLDFVQVDPTSQPKSTLGTSGLDVDADGQVDLTLAGVEQVEMYGTNDADTVSCGGGHGTGGPVSLSCILVGGGGDDTLIGGNGSDILSDGLGDDTVFGGAGNDLLGDVSGALGSTSSGFYGDGGYNTYYGGAGKDTFTHGVGHDTVSYADSKVKVKVSIDGKANDGAKGEHDNLGVGFRKIIGGKGNDVIDASSPPDGAPHTKYSFVGGAGNDKLTGFASADVLNGGAGNDTLTGLGGNDDLIGGAGKDKLYGGAGADGLDGGSNKDYCNGGSSADNYQHCEIKK